MQSVEACSPTSPGRGDAAKPPYNTDLAIREVVRGHRSGAVSYGVNAKTVPLPLPCVPPSIVVPYNVPFM
jgi:hypothetical protein